MSDMMQRIEKLEQLHDALCDAVQDIASYTMLQSTLFTHQDARIAVAKARIKGDGYKLTDEEIDRLTKDDNNDTGEVKRTSLHMKGAKDEQGTEGTDVVDDSRVRDRATYSSTVDEVMDSIRKAGGRYKDGGYYDFMCPIISQLVHSKKNSIDAYNEINAQCVHAKAEASKWETTAMCEKSRREKAEAELVDVKLERCVLRDATVDEVASALEEYGHYSVALVVRKMKEGQG